MNVSKSVKANQIVSNNFQRGKTIIKDGKTREKRDKNFKNKKNNEGKKVGTNEYGPNTVP